jgi:NAD(P)-dependent dehydrogenase (short-subunit alcohol dehydrogenase family)
MGKQDRTELVALRRLGMVEDCAKVVEFLATDLSDYVTGAVIPIDRGLVRDSDLPRASDRRCGESKIDPQSSPRL